LTTRNVSLSANIAIFCCLTLLQSLGDTFIELVNVKNPEFGIDILMPSIVI